MAEQTDNRYSTNKNLVTRQKPKPTAKKSKKITGGFGDFMRQQGVIGLAIGLVLGTQVKVLVDQIIASFINPLLGLALPGEGDLSKKTFALTVDDKVAIFGYGAFLYVFLSFIVVALVVYFTVKALRLDKLAKKK